MAVAALALLRLPLLPPNPSRSELEHTPLAHKLAHTEAQSLYRLDMQLHHVLALA